MKSSIFGEFSRSGGRGHLLTLSIQNPSTYLRCIITTSRPKDQARLHCAFLEALTIDSFVYFAN